MHVTIEGDTLSGLAGVYLGDPARWREIADANAIDDPLRARPRAPRWCIPGGPRRATAMSAVAEPFFAPRFEVRISGVTLAADLTDQVVSLVVETDLDLAGIVQRSCCATPTTRCSTRR